MHVRVPQVPSEGGPASEEERSVVVGEDLEKEGKGRA